MHIQVKETLHKTEIRNADDSDFVYLTGQEQAMADIMQRKTSEVTNALGFEIPITTLTAIHKSISVQKFYTVAPAQFIPVRIGNGAWSSNIETFREFQAADDFYTGIINDASDNSRLAQADAAIDGINVKNNNWAKGISWSLFQLRQAALIGNWDIVSAKERSRKRNWDLGIQKTAFLGAPDGNTNILGLFTQPDVAVNTAVIPKYIKDMNATEFQFLLGYLLPAYQANCNFTALPNRFAIPYLDYSGLGSCVDEEFPLKDRLTRLEETMQKLTMNPGFKVLPNAYADSVNNGLGYNVYALYNYEEESIRMDIPVDYTSTLQNTLNGFQFQNVGYGQFTGVKAYRPQEMVYFTNTDS